MTQNKIKLLFTFLLVFIAFSSKAYTERKFLVGDRTVDDLEKVIIKDRSWVNYPDYQDRDGWNKLMGNLQKDYIEEGEKYLDYQWQVVKATDYLAFERTGNRSAMEKPLGNNNNALISMILAELAEGKGRFLDQIINGVFHTCEMTSWSASAHNILQESKRPLPSYDDIVFDLGAGDMGNMLAWTYYFFKDSFDKVDPEISRRLKHELEVRILDVYRNASFWWMAKDYDGHMLNNWNPWCNSNALIVMMLIEDNPKKLAEGIYMTMDSVDKFLGYINYDGACEEGPAYWGHAVGKTLDYLCLLQTITGGKIDIFDNPMIKNMGEYICHSYVGDGWVVNFADASARININPYTVYRYGRAIKSEPMEHFASYLFRRKNTKYNKDTAPFMGRDLLATLYALSVHNELKNVEPGLVSIPYSWYPDTEFCYISNDNLFFAAKGGHNDESHNHNDVGTFTIWNNNLPILIDVGVGTYTAKTFSSQRYSIWSMQSKYHNLPMPNGVMQKYGKKYKAKNIKTSPKSFSIDIANAYPKEAKVKKWVRNYNVVRNGVRLQDNFEMESAESPNVISFMTWGNVSCPKDGVVNLKITDGTKESEAVLHYNKKDFDLEIEEVVLEDPRFIHIWGKSVYRLAFTAKNLKKRGSYKFFVEVPKNN